ncbi:Helix-turn-helix domain-containing protein [Catalinimonas alkaloidigena]|uniref:Helix-turn-helix domain-containing protein n=1 Tax=Catalinimonas alkaloidigena TaxID=1075417 RepID=A0A1G9A2D9_9BACT|nr:AraC family transcriptional regulator [Catalinimonas alkaloidigena]SDK21559.1 Helix-turn-helix domain-containing protein [Catalinimonas alkaloidigena]
MPGTQLKIKNMVCPRCIRVVREEMERLGYQVRDVTLGEVLLSDADPDLTKIARMLEGNGFALLADPKDRLVEQIKTEVIDLIRSGRIESLHVKLSDYLAERLDRDYTTLSHLFSTHEGITLERYTILQKIERAKELISYGELSMSEIAYQLGYRTIAHLSSQFRQIVGESPTAYRKSLQSRGEADPRRPLDGVTKR